MTDLIEPSKVFKSINKWYGAIFVVIVTFIVLSSLFVSRAGNVFDETNSISYLMQWIAIAATIGLIPAGYFFSQKQIKVIEPSLDLSNKLQAYKKALKLRFFSALIAAFLVSLFFSLTENTNLLLILAIILLFYIISKPNPFKTAYDLNLNTADKHRLMGK